MESGDKIIEAMAMTDSSRPSASKTEMPDPKIVADTCFNQLLKSYDPQMGGFSKAPKFPQPVNFNFLFNFYADKGPEEDKAVQALKMVVHTLEMMAKGGIHDHISQVLRTINWLYFFLLLQVSACNFHAMQRTCVAT